LGKTNQFKKGVLELCVLYLLQNTDRYGYELTQRVDKHISLTEGALYPILRRLVKEGYCETYLKESSNGPARKYYKITEEGRNYLIELSSEWDVFVKNVSLIKMEEDNEASG
jgi:PadR family transcriptional regulator PadR